MSAPAAQDHHPSMIALSRFAPLAAWFFWAVTATAVEPKPLLWRIDGAKPSYVFGTIHLGDREVTTLASATERALQGADALFTEVPLDTASQMKAGMQLMSADKPLSEVLPKELYVRAEAEVKRINSALTLQPFERMKVWALAVTIGLLEEQLKNPGAQPLDALLYARAEAAGKPVGGLETLEEQFNIFDKLSTQEQIAMLRAMLDDMEKARREKRSPFRETREAYLSGDLAQLEAKINGWASSLDDALEQRLLDAVIVKRNEVMAARMAAKLKEQPGKSLFFAIGAGHLAGEKGVLELLRRAGLK
ncbi:MAG: TraB/GumN family protein, partial [Verrucomicrobiota bacterium]|nr:TraB/GumN family protein [Verrucomicrobiota bacterium]